MTPLAASSTPVDPLAESTGGTWTRASLAALFAGRAIRMRDLKGHSVAVPAWLAEAAGQVEDAQASGWLDNTLNTHPLDRAAVATAWRAALERPGEVMPCSIRAEIDGELRWFEEIAINLIGHDGLQVVLGRLDQGPALGTEHQAELDSTFTFVSVPILMEYIDPVGNKLWSDGAVEEIYGRTSDEMIGHACLEYIDERYHDAIVMLFLKLVEEPGRSQSIQFEILHTSGRKIWVETTLINRLSDDRIGAVLALTHDITDQLAAEKAQQFHDRELRRSHEEFETLANQVPAAVFRTDCDGAIAFANQQWNRIAGNDHTYNLTEVVATEDRSALLGMLARLASPDGPGEASIEVQCQDSVRVFLVSCQAVGEAGGTVSRPVIGSITDVTSTSEFRHLAQHDDLTGLLNRHGIERRLHDALADDSAHVVVAFLDLDGFKLVNDDHGHDAGDEVLRAVADRLRDAVRPSDHVARYGGDEFVIVCVNASTAAAEQAVRARIEEVLTATIEFTGGVWHPVASIGLARAHADEDLASVLRRADQAMYATKREHHAAIASDR